MSRNLRLTLPSLEENMINPLRTHFPTVDVFAHSLCTRRLQSDERTGEAAVTGQGLYNDATSRLSLAPLQRLPLGLSITLQHDLPHNPI